MRNLPDIADMMEELADQVLIQMNRKAVTGFKTSLREMTDFHKFLIAAHTAKENGKTFNLAQISGNWTYRAPYKEWSSEYVRLMDKAAELIDINSAFIAYLSSLPLRLLPKSYKEVPLEMVYDLLDLPRHLVWKMEGWVSNRRVDYTAEHSHINPPLRAPDPVSGSGLERTDLSGTDIKSYQRSLERVISSWEHLLSHAKNFYQWERAKAVSPEVYWAHLSAGWPYLERHLENTAYMFAASVWNKDDIGASDFASTLLRWSDKAVFFIKNNNYYFQNETLITRDIMRRDWMETQSLARVYTFREDRVDPASLMTNILRNAHKDSIMVACGVIVGWHLNGKLRTDLPLKAAKGILEGTLLGEGSQYEGVVTSFTTFMLNLIRIFGSLTYQENAPYKGTIDSWVEKLDGMSERRVIPGRPYSPSTKHHCEDLVGAWVVCALALFSETPTEAEGFQQKLESLVDNESYFAWHDASIRSVENDLSKMREILGHIEDEYLEHALNVLVPEVQEIQKEQFSNLLSELIEVIESKRLERIRQRPIDIEKMEKFKDAANVRLLNYNEKRRVFENVKISQSQDRRESPFSHRINNFSKGQLVIPVMDYEISDYNSSSEYLQGTVYGGIVRSLLNKIKCVENLDSKDDFWRKIKEQSEHIEKPALYVGQWFDYQTRLEFINNDPYNFGDYSGGNSSFGEAHICTLGDLEVFRLNSGEMLTHYNVLDTPRPKAILFSLTALDKVIFHEMENGDITEVVFEQSVDDPWKGSLVFRYSPEFIWRSTKVFEFSYLPEEE